MRRDRGDDLAVSGEHRLDALAGVERELVDRGEIGRMAHRDGHHFAAPRTAQLVRKDMQLLRDLLADALAGTRVDLHLRELHPRDPQMLGQGRDDRVLAAETLLHEDAAELAAPLLLVPERALELVLVDNAQFGEQLSESLARRHRSPSYRFTRARYSSREKTPFSMSSSTIAFSAATDLRCVSSTPRRTSTALWRAGAACPGDGFAVPAADLRATCMSTTVFPALLTIFTDSSASSR